MEENFKGLNVCSLSCLHTEYKTMNLWQGKMCLKIIQIILIFL